MQCSVGVLLTTYTQRHRALLLLLAFRELHHRPGTGLARKPACRNPSPVLFSLTTEYSCSLKTYDIKTLLFEKRGDWVLTCFTLPWFITETKWNSYILLSVRIWIYIPKLTVIKISGVHIHWLLNWLLCMKGNRLCDKVTKYCHNLSMIYEGLTGWLFLVGWLFVCLKLKGNGRILCRNYGYHYSI